MPTREPTRTVRNWVMDSRHWNRFNPRPDDIVIATPPKCGTTWMQRIVSLLVFQSTDPVPLHEISPWLDCRFMMPLDVMLPMLEAQAHRRFVKSHLPFDALPVHDEVRYIHVARDGRDACMSMYNHAMNYTPDALARFDAIGMGDETLGKPMPALARDPRQFFRDWISTGEESHGGHFFETETSYWHERGRNNLLLVHYNDLKADLDGEMRRISAFLGIPIDEEIWPTLVEAARFENMKAQGRDLLPGIGMAFQGGHESFLYRGTNGRWRELLRDDDLALYEEKAAVLAPALRRWLAEGRLRAGDPRDARG